MKTTGFFNASAPARVGTAATYNGFYLRGNLNDQGSVPASSPYNLCPDIIQSGTPLEDPQNTLSTLASWQTLYNTAPSMGANYYYVRGLNGAPTSFTGNLSLYWAPAQLILFPTTWENNPLTTASGMKRVAVAANLGHIGVGADAFVLQYPGPLYPEADSFYAFVAQNTTTPIPEINSWMEMSQLMTQQLSFGFRNMVTFAPTGEGMLYRLGVNIPASIGQPGTLQVMITATGFPAGDTVGFIGDCFTPEMKEIVLEPTKMSNSPYITGIQTSLDPGFSSSLAFQYWNTAQTVPIPGSTITLSVDYVIPDEQIAQAIQMNVLNSGYSQRSVTAGISVKPQLVAPLGAVSFVVGPSDT